MVVRKKVGLSLNNAMYKRPYLTPLLFDVLIRFRLNTIGIIADIDKAYFHISEADCHRDFLRFCALMTFSFLREQYFDFAV